MKYPESFKELINCFEMFPGIGPKTAERLAYFAILDLKKEDAILFSQSILKAIESVKKCQVCGMLTDKEKCEICEDSTRENKIVVVESPKDVIALEKTGAYKGKYHVLNGVISPMNGVMPEDINILDLKRRIQNNNVKEIIVATSSTIAGEMTALYIKKSLEDVDVEVYRIGYGLPVGADIEYADEITLMKALEGKTKI